MTVDDFVAKASGARVVVASPQATGLRELLRGPRVTVTSSEPSVLEVEGLSAEQIGDIAAAHNLVLHQLTPVQASLEEAFMALTHDQVEYKAPDHSVQPTELAA
jgi:ABC-2 type transport system ATP-binding protein